MGLDFIMKFQHNKGITHDLPAVTLNPSNHVSYLRMIGSYPTCVDKTVEADTILSLPCFPSEFH